MSPPTKWWFAALAPALFAACGDDALEPDAVDPVGSWETRVENITGPTGAEPVRCTATWVMVIAAVAGAPAGTAYQSRVPLDARLDCTDGYSAAFGLRGFELDISRTGARLVFLRRVAADTLAVAEVGADGMLRGTLAEKFYGGGDLRAVRAP